MVLGNGTRSSAGINGAVHTWGRQSQGEQRGLIERGVREASWL